MPTTAASGPLPEPARLTGRADVQSPRQETSRRPGAHTRSLLAHCLFTLCLFTLCLLTLGLGSLAGCSAAEEPERFAGPLAEGPLTSITPQAVTYQPSGRSQVVSFGSVVLCSTRAGADITLDRIRYDFSTAPVSATPWLRTVPVIDQRTRGRDFDWRPLTISQGFPPSTFTTGPYLGTFTKDLESYDLTQSCFGVENLGSRRQELLTAIKAGEEGVSLERIMVDYHVGITDYTLTVPVDLRICGDEVC